MRNLLKIVVASAAVVAIAAPAQAGATIYTPPAIVASCGTSDLSVGAQACAGFAGGNLLGGSSSMIADAQYLLKSIGFTGNAATQAEAITLNSNTIDFATLLNGTTFIGIHFGNGQGGPVSGNSPGGATAFYRFDSGVNLNSFTDRFAGGTNSTAVLYSTGARTGAVPEPATWAMMLVGFGAAGISLRRRAKPVFQAA